MGTFSLKAASVKVKRLMLTCSKRKLYADQISKFKQENASGNCSLKAACGKIKLLVLSTSFIFSKVLAQKGRKPQRYNPLKTRSSVISEIATVTTAYNAVTPEQLSLSPGQLILVKRKNPDGWWEGELQVLHLFLFLFFVFFWLQIF